MASVTSLRRARAYKPPRAVVCPLHPSRLVAHSDSIPHFTRYPVRPSTLPPLTMRASAFVFAAALALFGTVAAAPSQSDSQCSTSSLRCCNDVQPASSPSLSPIIDALKLNLDTNSHVGLACDPINPTTVGGGQSWYVGARCRASAG